MKKFNEKIEKNVDKANGASLPASVVRTLFNTFSLFGKENLLYER